MNAYAIILQQINLNNKRRTSDYIFKKSKNDNDKTKVNYEGLPWWHVNISVDEIRNQQWLFAFEFPQMLLLLQF